MTLRLRIQDDMKAALRARETARLGAIRLLQAAVRQREVDERTELDDAQVVAVVDRLIKQRRDSIEQFEKAGRADLAAAEKLELDVLSAYLPARLDDAAIDTHVADAIRQSGAASLADLGRVMAILKPALAGQADMSTVSARVRKALS